MLGLASHLLALLFPGGDLPVRTHRAAVGRVAEFCPYCRDIRALAVFRATHRPDTSLGFLVGGAVTLELECEVCGGWVSAADARYTHYSTTANADLHDLIAETNPRLPAAAAESRRLAECSRRRELSPFERSAYLALPFQYLAPRVARWCVAVARLRRRLLVVAIVAITATALISERAPFVAAAVVIPLLLVWYGWRRRRYLRRRVLQPLAVALVPEQLTFEELDRLLGHLPPEAQLLQRIIRTRALWSAMQRAERLAVAAALSGVPQRS